MPTFLVPGFTQTAGAWSEVIAALPLRAEVIALDVPNQPTFTDTVDALAVAGGVGMWAGYSMGGRLALTLALARPDLVQRLVLVSTGVGIENDEERHARVIADHELAAHAEALGTERFLDEWMSQPLFAGQPASARSHRIRSADVLAHQLRVLGQGQMPPLWSQLAQLAIPVLLLTGTDDHKYDSIAAQAAARLPQGIHKRIPGGHGLLHEAPVAVARAIEEFTH